MQFVHPVWGNVKSLTSILHQHCRKHSHRRHHSNTGSLAKDEVSNLCLPSLSHNTMQVVALEQHANSSARTHASSSLLQVFVPPKKDEHPPDFSINDFALGRFAFIFVTLTMGWPSYLFFNVTGRPYKSK